MTVNTGEKRMDYKLVETKNKSSYDSVSHKDLDSSRFYLFILLNSLVFFGLNTFFLNFLKDEHFY